MESSDAVTSPPPIARNGASNWDNAQNASAAPAEQQASALWQKLTNNQSPTRCEYVSTAHVGDNCRIPCPRHQVVTVRTKEGDSPIHANSITFDNDATPALNAAASSAKSRTAIAAQSPQSFVLCEKFLVQGLASGNGLFQFISRKAQAVSADRTSGSSREVSIIDQLREQMRLCNENKQRLILGGRYQVVKIERSSDDQHHRRTILKVLDLDNSRKEISVPLTQAGLRFTGHVLAAEQIKHANTLMDQHKACLPPGDALEACNQQPTDDPLIASFAGIGRNATLITYREVRNRLAMFPTEHRCDTEWLDKTLFDVINIGRRYRGNRFLHSDAQLQELRKALMECVQQRNDDIASARRTPSSAAHERAKFLKERPNASPKQAPVVRSADISTGNMLPKSDPELPASNTDHDTPVVAPETPATVSPAPKCDFVEEPPKDTQNEKINPLVQTIEETHPTPQALPKNPANLGKEDAVEEPPKQTQVKQTSAAPETADETQLTLLALPKTLADQRLDDFKTLQLQPDSKGNLPDYGYPLTLTGQAEGIHFKPSLHTLSKFLRPLRKQLEGSHQLQGVAHDNDNCWMRASWMSVLKSTTPTDLAQRLSATARQPLSATVRGDIDFLTELAKEYATADFVNGYVKDAATEQRLRALQIKIVASYTHAGNARAPSLRAADLISELKKLQVKYKTAISDLPVVLHRALGLPVMVVEISNGRSNEIAPCGPVDYWGLIRIAGSENSELECEIATWSEDQLDDQIEERCKFVLRQFHNTPVIWLENNHYQVFMPVTKLATTEPRGLRTTLREMFSG